MSRTVLFFIVALITVTMNVSCQTKDRSMELRQIFEEYIKYHNAHETNEILSFYSEDFILFFTEYDVEVDKDGLVDILGWDKGVNGHIAYEDLTIEQDSISGLFTEQNDFLKLIGIQELKASVTYRFDASGKIVKQAYTLLPDQPSIREKIHPCVQWAKANRPFELQDIYPNDQILFNEESGRRWISLLKEWEEAVKPQ